MKANVNQQGRCDFLTSNTAAVAAVTVLLLFPMRARPAEQTWRYAVELRAEVQTSPARITLRWRADPGASGYTVYRKAKNDMTWVNEVANLLGSETMWPDNNVSVGTVYEYKVFKNVTIGENPPFTGYGYILAGIEAPPVLDGRGKVILMVRSTHAAALATELARLEKDLIGDGWTVIRHDVSDADTYVTVRDMIKADYNADQQNVKAVFLFGHIPIYRTGNRNVDGHKERPLPCDSIYGDVHGSWNPSQNDIPSDIDLQVGRVDLWNLGCINDQGSGSDCTSCQQLGHSTPAEVELLRNYLNKNHNFRHRQGQFANVIPNAALVGDRFGLGYVCSVHVPETSQCQQYVRTHEAFAAAAYRNFAPFVGQQITVANSDNDPNPPNPPIPDSQRWISYLDSNVYLWAGAFGGGDWDKIAFMGVHPDSEFVWSSDLYSRDAQAVFTIFFGSWFLEWDRRGEHDGWQCFQGNPMRTMLATPTYGLACSWSGRPHLFYHHMGLGETIGYGIRLSQNNNGMYQNHANNYMRGTHIALHGDPTLRLHQVKPPSNLKARFNSSGVHLTWTASPEASLYHVYRAPSPNGPFTRLTTGGAVSGTSYSDACQTSAANTYMVRAMKLEVCSSGSYYNLSHGIFAAVQNDLEWIGRPDGPGARIGHSVVKANNEIIVWGGGRQGVFLQDGGRYNLANNQWTEIPAGGPVGRWFHSAVWTGSKMIVWGGRPAFMQENHSVCGNGSAWDPGIGWGSFPTGPLSPRSHASAIWTGTEMIIWGGTGDAFTEKNDGARCDANGNWQMLPAPPIQLQGRFQHTAIWTGSEMIIWGGVKVDGYIQNEVWTSFQDGAKYTPGGGWTYLPATDPNVPQSRTAHSAVWTGQEMIIWGGRNLPAYTFLNTGARYRPSSHEWKPMSTVGAPLARADHAAVWADNEMLVFGGWVDTVPTEVNTGGHYSPTCGGTFGSWLPTSMIAAPQARYFAGQHTAVWANNAMFIYGGWYDYPYEANSTAQYRRTP